MKFAYGTYDKPGQSLRESIEAIAREGFSGVELYIAPGYLEPASLGTKERRELGTILSESKLELAALLFPHQALCSAEQHRANLIAVHEALQLVHESLPTSKPRIIFTFGGGDWEKEKDLLLVRLGEYGPLLDEFGAVATVKAHYFSCCRDPEKAAWLLRTLAHPRIRLGFDYSHFFLSGHKLEDCLDLLLPWTDYIHIKDSQHDRPAAPYLLPGEGTTDYAVYSRILDHYGWKGWLCPEISRAVFDRPNYDRDAARTSCFRLLSRFFGSAGI